MKEQPSKTNRNFLYLSDKDASICQQALSVYLNQELPYQEQLDAYKLSQKLRDNRSSRDSQ